MSRRLNSSLKKIEELFDECYRKGIGPDDVRWSKRTKNTYTNMIKSLAREIHRDFGVADFSKVKEEQVNRIIQRRIVNYHNGDLSEAFNLQTVLAAVNAFNFGVKNTNRTYKKKFSLADVKKMRGDLKSQNIIRKGSASTVLRATPEESESVLQNIKNDGYQTETRKMAYAVSRIGLETGGRISSILRLKAGDFDVSGNTITFNKDKGGLTRSVIVSEEIVHYLKSLKSDRKENERIFSSRRRDKTFKSVEEMRKDVSRLISSAGRHLNRTEKVRVKDKDGKIKFVNVNRKFSSHSFRKSFALSRVKEYHGKFNSKSQLDKYVAKRINQDDKIKEKLDGIRQRINKERKTKRDLTREEYSIFFTSIDLGHFRNDVIASYYTTFEEVKNYYDE